MMNLAEVGGNPVTYGPAIDVNIVGGSSSAVDITAIGGNAVAGPDLPVQVNNFPGTQTVAGTVAVSNLPVTQPVSGTVSVDNFPASQTVDGTVGVNNFPATQTVAGTVAVSNTGFDVNNFPATQPVSGTVSVANFPASQTVDGTVGVNNFPATQTVSGTVAVSNTGFDVNNFPIVQSVTLGDSATQDAFSRVRVSQPENIFSAQVLNDIVPTLLEPIASGTGVAAAFNSTQRVADLTVAAGTGVSALQSYQYIRYQPGKSQLILQTFVYGAAVAGQTVRSGYFDGANGIFLERDGAGDVYFVRRDSTSGSLVDNKVLQSAWNLDTLPSLDLTKAQILVIDLQYLGMGRVRCGFDLDGVIVYAHQFLNANVLSLPYMQTASLPMRIENNCTATGAASTVKFKCAAVVSEGGQDTFSVTAFSSGEGIATAANGARTLLFTLRPKTVGVGGLASRTLLILTELNLVNLGTNAIRWELVVGANTTPGAFTDVATNYSNFEYASAGTFTSLPATGYVVQSGYLTASGQVKTSVDKNLALNHPCSLNAAGANTDFNTFSVLVTGIGGTSDCRCSVDFQEA